MHHVAAQDIVILSATRTPVGLFRAGISPFDAIDLGAFSVGEALQGRRRAVLLRVHIQPHGGEAIRGE
jgi:hypothetical protein